MTSEAEQVSGWSVRKVIARHPITAFLVMALVVNIAVSLSPVLTRRDLLPFEQAPYDWLSHIFGLALPAFLVTASIAGREGVRDLAARSLRWQVGIRWYAFALLGVPVLTTILSAAFLGSEPLSNFADEWPLVFTVVLPHLLLIILFSNVAEEIGYTGFLFDRIQNRYSPLAASAIVTLPFALTHIPGWFVEFESGSEILLITLVLLIPHLCSRILAAWFYNGANRSVLIVGLFHCSFNVTTGAFAPKVLGLNGEDNFSVTSLTILIAAVVVVAITKGRLGQRRRT